MLTGEVIGVKTGGANTTATMSTRLLLRADDGH
jgi:hypothetical protein